jgi:hypothetical protein
MTSEGKVPASFLKSASVLGAHRRFAPGRSSQDSEIGCRPSGPNLQTLGASSGLEARAIWLPEQIFPQLVKLPSRMRNSERRLINRLNNCGPWDHRQILPGYPPAVQGDRPRTKKALSDTTGMGVMLVRSVWTVTGSTSTEGHIRIIAGHPQSKKIDHLMPWRFRKTSSQH